MPSGLLDGRFDPNADLEFQLIDRFTNERQIVNDRALFSLKAGSKSLDQFGLLPSDIFITDFDGSFSLYASGQSLGLAAGATPADIDALDTGASRRVCPNQRQFRCLPSVPD